MFNNLHHKTHDQAYAINERVHVKKQKQINNGTLKCLSFVDIILYLE